MAPPRADPGDPICCVWHHLHGQQLFLNYHSFLKTWLCSYLSEVQYNAGRTKEGCRDNTIYHGFFPKRYVSVPTPVMGRGTGRRLAVVCCWWGQRERGEYMWGRRWHLMGQYLPWQQHWAGTEDGALFWCFSWARESVPFCLCLYESQKPHHPEGSSEPLGDLSSHPLPPYVSACRSCISLDPLATHSMSAKNFSVLAHMRVVSSLLQS